jgi:penicillin-binding protein 1A
MRKLRFDSGARTPRSRGQQVLFFLKWGIIAGLALSALLAATVAILFWVYGSDPDLPHISSLSDYEPPEVSRVLSSDGKVIGEIFRERRTFVSFEKMPKVLVHAFVAAEDAKFFEHKGIDYMGMVRALIVNIRSGEHRQGGSTITQQVVKNFLLTRQKTLKRKFQEIILARRLENRLTKEEILTLYANQIFFGDGRYGVQEASRYYFGKDVSDLDVGEAALLAGLPQAPSRYSPKKPENRDAAKRRQSYVLRQMAENGFISNDEAQKWINAPIKVVADPYPDIGSAPEWVEMARQALIERYGAEALYRAGVSVVTTVDLEVQHAAEEALRNGLRNYDRRKGFGHALRRLKPEQIEAELARMAKKLPDGGPKSDERYPGVVREIHDSSGEMVVDLGNWKAAVLLDQSKSRDNPEGKKPSDRFANGDVVMVQLPAHKAGEDAHKPKYAPRAVELARGPEGALVVLDPTTRRVLAVVGGYASEVAEFNRATMAKRQAGSTFKPFLYAAAIDSERYTAGTTVDDSPEVLPPDVAGTWWEPKNYSRGKYEGQVRLRYALAKSINTVAAKVTFDIGPANVAAMAKKIGIESPLPEVFTIGLGSGEVTPLELTNAFATFAAGGRTAKPQVLDKIISREGTTKIDPPVFTTALRPEVAYIILDMMRSVVQEGTGGGARVLKMDVAGKTGTSNESRDAWFVGITPRLAVGVWVGFDDFKTPLGHGETGGETSVPIFVELMKKIGKRSDRFVKPAGLVDVVIDKATGKRAAEGVTQNVLTELYLPGTEPTEEAPRPNEVDLPDFVTDQYADPYADGSGATGGAGAPKPKGKEGTGATPP